jgi:heavy metal sensor kinase
MIRSLRWRLQAWYALVLFGVVAGFAAILYYRVYEARLQAIDRRLEAWGQYLDATLRSFPNHELDGTPPPKPPPGKGPRFKDDKRPPPPPPWRPRERLLADLDLPAAPDAGLEGAYFGVWRADGSAIKTSGLPDGVAGPPEPPATGCRVIARGLWREAVLSGPRGTRILVGASVACDLAELDAYAWQLAAIGGAVLAVGLAGGWLIARRIVRPIAVIARTASAISATSLGERIDPARVDSELAELARVLNATFDRLQGEFDRQTRFTADASHELRTPLTLLRTHAELALARPRSPEEYREALEACLRAARRMTSLVESLLTLARADAGRLDLHCRPVDLARTTRECVELLQPLAAGRDVAITAELAPVAVVGDADRLAQVVTNLLGNAVQYNCPGGKVAVRLAAEDGTALLEVTDTGCDIPEEDRPHLFERFYRVDKARTRAAGGNGLGLAICKSIVEAHGGAIDFATEAGRGTTFRVRLPAARPPAA